MRFRLNMKFIFLIALVVCSAHALNVPGPLFAKQQAAAARPVGSSSDVTCEVCEATVGQQ